MMDPTELAECPHPKFRTLVKDSTDALTSIPYDVATAVSTAGRITLALSDVHIDR